MCLLLLGLMAPGAHGSCIAMLPAGFPHADVRHYPANIRGLLFQAPDQNPLLAQDFAIASTDDGRQLQVRIEPVLLPADSAAARNLPRRTQLVRIMLEGGYTPGSTYSIRYTVPRSLPMQYPDAVGFTVDPAPVAPRFEKASLLLHLPQVRMHLVENEDTGMYVIAATRRLEMRVPAALQRYQDAISFFPEWADIGENGTTAAWTPLRQTATACSGESFGAGRRDRPDIVYQACREPLQGKALRVSTGFFEIDDRLYGLPSMRVDWDADTQAACAIAARRVLSRSEVLEAAKTGVLPGAAAGAETH